MVNRTNNTLDCYNKRFNGLLDKQPTLLEFVQIIEKETQFQAEKFKIFGQESKRRASWECVGPEISLAYYTFKESMDTPVKTIAPIKESRSTRKEY